MPSWRSMTAAAERNDSSPSGCQLPFLYGTAWKQEATTDLVVKAIRQGFKGIDTACQPKHYREDLVGAALFRLATEHNIPRETLWIQTKFTTLNGQDASNVPYDPNAPLARQVEQSIARSLQNLRTTYIDSLVLHSPLDSLNATLQVWKVFEDAVDKGIVKQLGISNCYDPRMFMDLYDRSRIKPQVLQNRFYAESGFDAELRAFCLDKGITYQTFWTLSANDVAMKSRAVQGAATRLRATPAQVLFRWLIQEGHQPLTGTKSLEHMRQDLDVVNFELSLQEMDQIGALFSRGS